MQIAVLGTGMVGNALATKLAGAKHRVVMGSRSADNPKAVAWASQHGGSSATFAQAVERSELIVNCVNGAASLEALQSAGAERIGDKIILDVANLIPPDPSSALSLGERIQQAFPRARVVKSLNTLNCDLMLSPEKLKQPTSLFVSGNDAQAKQRVQELLASFGWKDIIDLGDITTARATETYLTFWLTLYRKLGRANFNVQVVRA